ncbi:MAG: glycosyltransferase family 2 protein [Actinomycetales bacterium]|nr:glycosyltransferase family 2 protein [Actinomycetales bacterium]
MTRGSVVIPSRGGAERLPRILAALVAQQGSDWEAVVVLDGDIDDSAAVVARYAVDHPVRAVVFPENQGRAAALNAGFATAEGDVLIRADDDLEPGTDYVARHVAHHEAAWARGEEVGIVGMCWDVFPATPYSRAYGEAADRRIRATAYQAPADQTWRYWCGNVSTSRATYDRIGPYDEAFRAYGMEDIDWGYRLHRVGVPVHIAADVACAHHSTAMTTVERATRAFSSGASRRAFERKHGTGPLAARHGASASPADVAAADADVQRVRQDPWSALVRTAARGLTPSRVRQYAGLVDRVLPVLPRPVGEKAVALVVESAGLAGLSGSPGSPGSTGSTGLTGSTGSAAATASAAAPPEHRDTP